ncbi:ATP-binding protein, partial [Gilvimarinus sp. F26214L]|uniref:ATP-binding protein n=1 Tax=Gilvimarinus sp. DZF01 TaxID=3461371 RepID=UPI0040459FC0
ALTHSYRPLLMFPGSKKATTILTQGDKGDTKAVEIAQTICAFSNTEGGDLIIGVTDNVELVGIDEQVRRAYKASLQEALSSYCKDLNKLLFENLTESNCFSISEVKISGVWVVCVLTSRTTRWNFLTTTEVPYVRKGSSNANATRLAVMGIREGLKGSPGLSLY